MIVLVGRLHFCVKKAALSREISTRQPRVTIIHTSDGGFFIFLEIVVYKTEDEGGLPMHPIISPLSPKNPQKISPLCMVWRDSLSAMFAPPLSLPSSCGSASSRSTLQCQAHAPLSSSKDQGSKREEPTFPTAASPKSTSLTLLLSFGAPPPPPTSSRDAIVAYRWTMLLLWLLFGDASGAGRKETGWCYVGGREGVVW